MNFRQKFEIKKTIYNASKLSHNISIKSCYYFTDRKKDPNLKQAIKNLPKNSAIIFREYDLPSKERESLAREYLQLATDLRLDFIVGKDYQLALKIKARGVHFSDQDIKLKPLLTTRLLCQKNNLIFSFALHRDFNLSLLKKYHPDIIFLSPIFATSSHENSKIIGIFNFIKLRQIYQKKFANFNDHNFLPLGGINLQNLSRLNKINIASFGAIDFFKNL